MGGSVIHHCFKELSDCAIAYPTYVLRVNSKGLDYIDELKAQVRVNKLNDSNHNVTNKNTEK